MITLLNDMNMNMNNDSSVSNEPTSTNDTPDIIQILRNRILESESECNQTESDSNQPTPSPAKGKGTGNTAFLNTYHDIPPNAGGPIYSPQANDVLSGRGGRINSHQGNVYFRQLVSQYRDVYLSPKTRKLEKIKVAEQLVMQIRNLDPPGRFLKEGSVKDGQEKGAWYEIGDFKARKKAGQAMREKIKEEKEGGGGSSGVNAKLPTLEDIKNRPSVQDMEATLNANMNAALAATSAAASMNAVESDTSFLPPTMSTLPPPTQFSSGATSPSDPNSRRSSIDFEEDPIRRATRNALNYMHDSINVTDVGGAADPNTLGLGGDLNREMSAGRTDLGFHDSKVSQISEASEETYHRRGSAVRRGNVLPFTNNSIHIATSPADLGGTGRNTELQYHDSKVTQVSEVSDDTALHANTYYNASNIPQQQQQQYQTFGSLANSGNVHYNETGKRGSLNSDATPQTDNYAHFNMGGMNYRETRQTTVAPDDLQGYHQPSLTNYYEHDQVPTPPIQEEEVEQQLHQAQMEHHQQLQQEQAQDSQNHPCEEINVGGTTQQYDAAVSMMSMGEFSVGSFSVMDDVNASLTSLPDKDDIFQSFRGTKSDSLGNGMPDNGHGEDNQQGINETMPSPKTMTKKERQRFFLQRDESVSGVHSRNNSESSGGGLSRRDRQRSFMTRESSGLGGTTARMQSYSSSLPTADEIECDNAPIVHAYQQHQSRNKMTSVSAMSISMGSLSLNDNGASYRDAFGNVGMSTENISGASSGSDNYRPGMNMNAPSFGARNDSNGSNLNEEEDMSMASGGHRVVPL